MDVDDAEHKRKPQSGTASATIESMSQEMDRATDVVHGMLGGFRRCYNELLSNNPMASGDVTLRVVIARDGKVIQADATSAAPLAEAPGCIQTRTKSAKFAAPRSAPATMVIAIRLRPATSALDKEPGGADRAR